jgi:hypothetical protein
VTISRVSLITVAEQWPLGEQSLDAICSVSTASHALDKIALREGALTSNLSLFNRVLIINGNHLIS